MWHIMQVLTYSYILATPFLLVMQENSATPLSLQNFKFWEKSKVDDISPVEWNGSVEELEDNKTKMDSLDDSDDSTESSHIHRMLSSALFGNHSPKSESRSFSARPISKQGWGTHSIGTREDFILDSSSSHLKWVAYFYDQAVAAVLHNENGTIIKCTVQENIQKWEQDLALEFLGDLMPLAPLQFDLMMHLVTLCGTLNMPKNIPSPSHPDTLASLLFDSSTLQGILPGTLWCGVRDRAKHFGELGPRYELDSCCRSHDYCPIKVLGWNTRYGVPNLNFRTIQSLSLSFIMGMSFHEILTKITPLVFFCITFEECCHKEGFLGQIRCSCMDVWRGAVGVGTILAGDRVT
ncbi:hypothetical protein SK128_008112 [Halocaridina rubra]|uniref:Phospholipase A2-like central domain-containing protein n=1 Tax=Halocaridina rubra TaxID=373956 RepID=A0AAN8XAA7_HALRR